MGSKSGWSPYTLVGSTASKDNIRLPSSSTKRTPPGDWRKPLLHLYKTMLTGRDSAMFLALSYLCLYHQCSQSWVRKCEVKAAELDLCSDFRSCYQWQWVMSLTIDTLFKSSSEQSHLWKAGCLLASVTNTNPPGYKTSSWSSLSYHSLFQQQRFLFTCLIIAVKTVTHVHARTHAGVSCHEKRSHFMHGCSVGCRVADGDVLLMQMIHWWEFSKLPVSVCAISSPLCCSHQYKWLLLHSWELAVRSQLCLPLWTQ